MPALIEMPLSASFTAVPAQNQPMAFISPATITKVCATAWIEMLPVD